jgi:hypothetical protein
MTWGEDIVLVWYQGDSDEDADPDFCTLTHGTISTIYTNLL